jgi:hypothetical protein
MELGGQALERWPHELFVTAEHATQARSHFLPVIDRPEGDPIGKHDSQERSCLSHR